MSTWQGLLLNKILQNKDYNLVRANGLDSTYFKNYITEFNFIENHYKKYGNIPDLTTFIANFPKFEIIEVNETNDFLLDRLYEEHGFDIGAPIIKEMDRRLQEDSRDAYNYLMANISKLKPHSVCNGIDIIRYAHERYEKYMDRNRYAEKATIKTGLPELDAIFGGWEFGDELITIVARTNMGKCLEKGTEILLSDGTYKKVEDIQIGDKVQSENVVNTVIGLHNGTSIGYKIIPNVGGEPFTVSDNHILTLMKKNYAKKERVLVDILIEDYLKLPEKQKQQYFLYRPTLEYLENKQLKIPPYILGLWLGDGNSNSVCLTNMDKEVIHEWSEYALQNNLQVTCRNISYDITSGTYKGSPKRNIILNTCKEYDLINNKHIPLCYLTAGREQRLQLLAGIIDTDGYYAKGQRLYEVTTKSESLAKDYYQLISGLGFKAKKGFGYADIKNKKLGPYYTISFSGDLHTIPVKLSRKKQEPPKIRKDYNCTRFKIEPVKKIQYYGFECDGDHRFILRDGTLTHNSWLCLKFLAEAWKQGYRVGLYSGEMSHIKLGYRFDALFNHFSNKSLTWGGQASGYKDYIDGLTKMQTPFIIIQQKDFGGRPTVQQIRNFVEENNIQILGIDQYSLMEDGRSNFRDPLRLKLAHIAEDLFLLSSEYKIPIIGLCQANRGGKKDNENDAPTLEDIKESDDISHNSSKCIGMRQSKFGLILDVIKNREGKVGDKLTYSWDIDTGYFSYIPSVGDAASEEIRNQSSKQVREEMGAANSFNPF